MEVRSCDAGVRGAITIVIWDVGVIVDVGAVSTQADQIRAVVGVDLSWVWVVGVVRNEDAPTVDARCCLTDVISAWLIVVTIWIVWDVVGGPVVTNVDGAVDPIRKDLVGLAITVVIEVIAIRVVTGWQTFNAVIFNPVDAM